MKFYPNNVIIIFTEQEYEDLKKTHLTTHYIVVYSVLRIVETLTVSGKNGIV